MDSATAFFTVVTATVLLIASQCVNGHGRLRDPPSRSSAGRYGFPVPINWAYDVQLNCGGKWQYPSSSQNYNRCGVCGDSFNSPTPRDNEAGGKYAKGIIVRNYTEGQRIDVILELTQPRHGGYSMFKICPNNDIRRPVTQQCLDRYLLATPTGETKIFHNKDDRMMYIQLMLPPGLVCSQCVLQWRWISDSHNHCNTITGECCNVVGCGLQENFYGCADVSIRGTSGPVRNTTPKINRVSATSPSTYPATRPVNIGGNIPTGFIPIGGIPVSAGNACKGTNTARIMYGVVIADAFCKSICPADTSKCPPSLCQDSCREMK